MPRFTISLDDHVLSQLDSLCRSQFRNRSDMIGFMVTQWEFMQAKPAPVEAAPAKPTTPTPPKPSKPRKPNYAVPGERGMFNGVMCVLGDDGIPRPVDDSLDEIDVMLAGLKR